MRQTPGHAPEHISFIAAESKRRKTPWGVFGGDSLFADSAGRPDIIGSERETKMPASQLFTTMTEFYANLDDGVTVYPGHGTGSSCGPDIGDRRVQLR